MKPIRVLLVDDHTLVRTGVRMILEQLPGVEVVGEASNGREALDFVKKHHPTIVLMDITMAGLNGVEATAYMTKEHPDVRVIILSMHASEPYVVQAVQAGAAGYLLKDAPRSELEFALTAVARGDTYLTPAVAKYVLSDYRSRLCGKPNRAVASALAHPLTAPERELLQLIAEGRTTKEIAATLHLSPKTIEARRARLMEQLHIDSIAGLVRYALRIGLVTLEG